MSSRFDCSDQEERRRGLEAAERALRFGELVVLPTDTVYGLAADAFSASAVDGLLSAKRRGRDMPVPVLVGAWSTLDGLVDVLPPAADALRKSFWPGGLTLIVRHAASLIWDLGDAFGTVGVRMPMHPVAIELLTRTGPLAVSSANISGSPPAVTCDEAQDQLGDDVSVYLDGGPAGEPVPSTIIDCTVDPPRLLRAGAISVEELRREVPDLQA
ncbi:MAG TPA: L-threonylcarbamoyladenylate synthase [Frankiaceae bacterium]|nr:L-threonylcarbamoyladenylate synthase [Frankiaceae bacterium]